MNDADKILKRLDRKLELMKMDAKAKGDAVKYDIDECLALVSMLERTVERTVKSTVGGQQ